MNKIILLSILLGGITLPAFTICEGLNYDRDVKTISDKYNENGTVTITVKNFGTSRVIMHICFERYNKRRDCIIDAIYPDRTKTWTSFDNEITGAWGWAGVPSPQPGEDPECIEANGGLDVFF